MAKKKFRVTGNLIIQSNTGSSTLEVNEVIEAETRESVREEIVRKYQEEYKATFQPVEILTYLTVVEERSEQ